MTRRGGKKRGGSRKLERAQPPKIELPLDLNEGEETSQSTTVDDKNKIEMNTGKQKNGKELYYERNKHRFDFNYKVLQWSYNDLQTAIPLKPVSDYFHNVKDYCNSFLQYVYEETRAETYQALETDSHGDIAKCKIMKWKKGKNSTDASSITFDIIPRQKQDSAQAPYIPLFQKHDFVVITREPNLKNLDKQNHFFAIIEEGNQFSGSKFTQQNQPWLRRNGGVRGRRGRKGRKRFAKNSSKPVMHNIPSSNLTTKIKAKFYSTEQTQYLLNMKPSKGRSRKAGKQIYHDEIQSNYWFATPIYNMVTKHREYESIKRMAVPEFLIETWTNKFNRQYANIPMQPRADNIAPPLKEYLRKNYNPAQFEVIDEVLNNINKKIHLVHGPPGSGKTSTLLGLIMGLLANKQRVLVCSGTNVAVDHIIIKMSEDGLISSNGERYDLGLNKMARIGNDEKIDKLSKEIDPATRFKRLVKMVKDIQSNINTIRMEQFEIMEKSRQSKTAFNAKNSILGRSEKITNLLDQTEQAIGKLITTKLVNNELVSTMHEKFEKVKEKMLEFLAMGKQADAKKNDLNTAAQAVYEQIDHLYMECQKYLVIDNRDVEKKILDNCELVFATLAITGRQMMRDCRKFNVLIIDEAAQVTESESMIPLDLITDKVVLIGDPQQLPSTVISQEAIHKGYDRSMFERILKLSDQGEQKEQNTLHKPILLDTQYRMHPSISHFPEQQFYSNTLKDGENVKQYDNHATWKVRYEAGLNPCLFINCPESMERFNPIAKSYENEEEADLVVKLIHLYMTKYGIPRNEIAVITFYRSQVELIRSKLAKYEERKQKEKQNQTNTPRKVELDEHSDVNGCIQNESLEEQDIAEDEGESTDREDDLIAEEDGLDEFYDVNTVDSYQGSEKQVCILSTVRANDRGSLGFCVDKRRLNVAITRAQFCLTIIGHGESLCTNDLWKSYIRAVKIMEPQDIPELNYSAIEGDHITRNVIRKNLRYVSAILKNTFIRNQPIDAKRLLDACISTDNHTLLTHLLKLGKINHTHVGASLSNGNILHKCIEERAYLCAVQLTSQENAKNLIYQRDNNNLLPIQLCIVRYAGNKKEKKEEIQKLFDKLCSMMVRYPPQSGQQHELHLQANDSVFSSKDKYGNTIHELVIRKGCAQLLEILLKYDPSEVRNTHLINLAKGSRCESIFQTHQQSTALLIAEETSSVNTLPQKQEEKHHKRQYKQKYTSMQQEMIRNSKQMTLVEEKAEQQSVIVVKLPKSTKKWRSDLIAS